MERVVEVSPGVDVRVVHPRASGKLFAVQYQRIVFMLDVTAETSVPVQVQAFREGPEPIYFGLLPHPPPGVQSERIILPLQLPTRPIPAGCKSWEPCGVCPKCMPSMRCCPPPFTPPPPPR